MKAGFKKVDGQFKRVDEQFKKVDDEFAKVDDQFNKIDGQFKKIDGHFKKIDDQFKKVDDEFIAVRTEMQVIRAELQAEIRSEGETTRRHFDIVAEQFKEYVKVLADGTARNTEARRARPATDCARDTTRRLILCR
jgi:archaellum component FlaC